MVTSFLYPYSLFYIETHMTQFLIWMYAVSAGYTANESYTHIIASFLINTKKKFRFLPATILVNLVV